MGNIGRILLDEVAISDSVRGYTVAKNHRED